MTTKIEISLAWAVIALFFWFWQQGGWYRVDCALGQSQACALIAADYAAAKP